jgi:hypothetical protein
VARTQAVYLPAEDFFDAEADDATVDQFVERNAEPLAFLVLLKPASGQSSDVGNFLGGVENLIAPTGSLLHHLPDGGFRFLLNKRRRQEHPSQNANPCRLAFCFLELLVHAYSLIIDQKGKISV